MTRVKPSLNNPWFVTALYTLIAVAMTWPLASVINTKIAWDLGDPALNCWIMMWTGGQLLRFLKGDISALADFWNGNIFYPEKLTIAYSEHLTPQMLQILPIYAATGNMVLCYNLLFLSSIVLSGLSMYLLVRELTQHPVAAFVAGVAFAWSPYHVDQFPHLQVISTQWMPLAFYGLRRYFVDGKVRALAGGMVAVVVQVLSCGYYLFFFTPFVAAYVVYEMASRKLWRNGRTWRQLIIASLLALLAIAPFILPYMRVREMNGMGVRSLNEVSAFSADTWGLFMSSENIALLGQSLVTRTKAEGNGFPGFTILLLGIAGIAVTIARARRHASSHTAPTRALWQRLAFAASAMTGAALLVMWVWLLVFGGGTFHALGGRASTHDLATMALRTGGWLVLTLLAVPSARRFVAGVPNSITGFFIIAWIASIALAWGPIVSAGGRNIGEGPYALLYNYVPGFNGMRVPGRFFMISSFCLAALVGVGFAAIARGRQRLGTVLAICVVGLMLIESAVVPFVINKALWVDHFVLQPAELRTANNLGNVYDTIRDLPQGIVVAEFPFGAVPFDTQATYYAGYHRKPLLNGFSGFFPASFVERTKTLAWDPTEQADAARQTLIESGVTHVVVHEGAYRDDKGPRISDWLRSSGARELASHGTDRLFTLK